MLLRNISTSTQTRLISCDRVISSSRDTKSVPANNYNTYLLMKPKLLMCYVIQEHYSEMIVYKSYSSAHDEVLQLNYLTSALPWA